MTEETIEAFADEADAEALPNVQQDVEQARVNADSEALRKRALAKAIGLDKATPEQRELALAWAGRYGLDLLLRHIVLIEGKPFITRDGLLHVAHRSERLNGIVVTRQPEIVTYPDGEYWTAEVQVWRNDMSQPFTFPGRYPVKRMEWRNRERVLVVAQYGPEMAIKTAESMSLRRAFDVAAPVAEERIDLAEDSQADTGDPSEGYQ